MSSRRFRRTTEDFVCEWCGTEVKGTGYTDHCPGCLSSKHVDINPGDRASPCQGRMTPTSAVYERGEFTITYCCRKCGAEKRVRAAAGDDRDLLVRLAAGPSGRKKGGA
jgi:ribosomal protein L37AE/L43A